MTAVKRADRTTVAEYLRLEAEAAERHEYFDGVVVAMAGESEFHADISANLVAVVVGQLRGSPCRGRTKDTKVRSGPAGPRPLRDAAGMFSYPDLVVICGEPEYFDDRRTVVTNPKVIFEVLSPSTEATDRGEKFGRYERWNPTLSDYLLVSQDQPQVEHFTRQPDGKWLYARTTGLDAAVAVPSIGCSVKLTDIYDRVAFPDPDAGAGGGPHPPADCNGLPGPP
jgi:Uma2 family endonuclease